LRILDKGTDLLKFSLLVYPLHKAKKTRTLIKKKTNLLRSHLSHKIDKENSRGAACQYQTLYNLCHYNKNAASAIEQRTEQQYLLLHQANRTALAKTSGW
jgi:hypothetical protein